MVKKAYFIGIAGTTMAGLALAFKKVGWQVSGSDQKDVYPPVTTFLEQNNISYFKGYSEGNLSKAYDLVVAGRSALMIDPKNPEYFKAKKLGLKVLSYPEVIRDCLIKENSIVVVGTFQKSTTTALIAWILINAGLDPSFMIGGLPLNFGEGTRITDSKYSVIEGDETPTLLKTDPPKFIFYKPKYLLLTATQYDHPEIYKTKDDCLNAYINLVRLLPSDGVLFYDPVSVDERVVKVCQCRKITFLAKTQFKLDKRFQESNLRAITLANELKLDPKIIARSIASFQGLRGREELLGEFGGRIFYKDLSQHPLKVKSTIEALKKQYPQNKIIVVFNPSSTSLKYKSFLKGFKDSFSEAEKIIVSRVDYLKEFPDEERVTGPDLVKAFGGGDKVAYEPIDERIISFLETNTQRGDLIVFMSSGGLRFSRLIERIKGELEIFGVLGGSGEGRDKMKRNVPLAEYTTFKIGGPADLFYEAGSEEELIRVVRAVREVGIPYFILGGGSNILVWDKGYRGMVIKCQMLNVKCQIYEKKAVVFAEAGVPVSVLLDKLVENSITGLEFMAGIPGTVGGAVRGNAGAWQQSFGDKVKQVKVLTEQGEIRWIGKEECNFGYRESRFKKGGEVVLGVELEMDKGDKKEIEGRVKEYWGKRADQPKEPSAGCIFVNPKPQAAGELIDQSGLKGTQIGGAKISGKHANFIVNVGGAKAADVVALIDLAKKTVKEKFNIDLKEEIVRVGEF